MTKKEIKKFITHSTKKNKTDIPIMTDSDSGISYETHGQIRQILDKVHLPLLNKLSPHYSKLAKKMSPDAKKLVEKAGSFNALEIIHEYDGFKPKSNNLKHLITAVGEYHWQHTATAKGGRNRLKMVKKIIMNIIKTSDPNLKHIIVQGASFCRPQIEILHELRKKRDLRITFIDKNDGPLDFAMKLAEELDVQDKVNFVKDKITNVDRYITDDILMVENIGISDYFDKDKSTGMAALVKNHLPEGGTYLTGNIRPNPEYTFVTEGGNWVMDYKYEEDLAEILADAGFKTDEILVAYEPCHVFGIVFNTKNIEYMKSILMSEAEKDILLNTGMDFKKKEALSYS